MNPLLVFYQPVKLAYEPPPGGLFAPNPRTVDDIVLRSLAIHAFAIFAYVHLASVLPLSATPRVVFCQIFLFALMPELVVVQLLSYGIIALYALMGLRMYNKSADPNTPPAEKSRPTLEDSKADPAVRVEDAASSGPSLVLRLLGLALNCLPLIATVLAYKQRLGIRYRAATYVGNLQLDHRNGWIAIGGLVAAGMTTMILVISHFYPKRPEIEERMRSLKFPLGALHIQAGMAVFIHVVLLEITNHFSIMGEVLAWLIYALLWAVSLIIWRFPKMWLRQYVATVAFIVYAILVSGLPEDIRELVNVSHNRVQPWNYRWKVKDLVSARSSVL